MRQCKRVPAATIAPLPVSLNLSSPPRTHAAGVAAAVTTTAAADRLFDKAGGCLFDSPWSVELATSLYACLLRVSNRRSAVLPKGARLLVKGSGGGVCSYGKSKDLSYGMVVVMKISRAKFVRRSTFRRLVRFVNCTQGASISWQ